MKKPIIGINPYYYEHNGAMWNATKESYYQSVWQAGGTAFTLNYPNNNNLIIEIAEIIDGLLLVGGPDIPIEIYNGCLLYTSPSPRDLSTSRMPSSA